MEKQNKTSTSKTNSKTRKVYLLSSVHGTWQVGNVVYCLPTNSAFEVDTRKPKKKGYIEFDVPKHLQGWDAVEEAKRLYDSERWYL